MFFLSSGSGSMDLKVSSFKKLNDKFLSNTKNISPAKARELFNVKDKNVLVLSGSASPYGFNNFPTFLQYKNTIRLPKRHPEKVLIFTNKIVNNHTKRAIEGFALSVKSYYPHAKIQLN